MITTKQDGKPVLYVHAPSLIPGGKAWMKVDVEQAMAALGSAGKAQGLLGATGQSPADALKLLEQVGSVTEVGTETIDGAETTHYHATVDVAEALAERRRARRGARRREVRRASRRRCRSTSGSAPTTATSTACTSATAATPTASPSRAS